MATREALQIEQQQNQKSIIEYLERIEGKLDELLSILNPEATEVDDDGAATFGDEPGEETADDGTHGGFMDTELEIDVTPTKKSKSKTL